jgi:hypothetical protein
MNLPGKAGQFNAQFTYKRVLEYGSKPIEDSIRAALDEEVRQRAPRVVIFNLGSAATSALILGLMLYRVEHRLPEAMRYFSAGKRITELLSAMLSKGLAGSRLVDYRCFTAICWLVT